MRRRRQEQQVLMSILLLSEEEKQKPSACGGKRSVPNSWTFLWDVHGPTGHHQVHVCMVAGENWPSHSFVPSIVLSGQVLSWASYPL